MLKNSRRPVIEEIDVKLSPPDAFEMFRDRRFSFFLDSGMDPEKLGRYSFIGSDPFLVSGGALKTPKIENGILPGITREAVLEIAAKAGITTSESNITPGELNNAHEAFLTNSVMEIMPLVEVGGMAIGSRNPGPLTRGLMAAYRELVVSMTSGQ